MKDQVEATITVNDDLIVNQAFTVQIRHVGMLSDLKERGLGKNASEIVRKAIEHYYKSLTPKAVIEA